MLMTQVPEPRVDGQRRLLALDGGGIRGVLTLEILTEIESMLRKEYEDPDLVLADYFDYIAGTSTGAMIAAGLALGWPVERIMGIYINKGPNMFETLPLFKRLRNFFGHKYPSDKLAADMREEYGEHTLFGDEQMRSLLLVVTHNSNTDSPWPLSNNPKAKYNDPAADDCNSRLLLWEVVRASTAAPLVYPPEPITLGDTEFVFVDGAITPYNNPAFQLYVQATIPEYRLGWSTGTDKMLLVSVGTGTALNVQENLTAKDLNGLHTLRTLPGTLFAASSIAQDIACRAVGRCLHGAPIDGELGDLSEGADEDRRFSYIRYNATLTEKGLRSLGLDHLTGEKTLKGIRGVAGMKWVPQLREIGRAVAREVDPETFAGFKGVVSAR